MPKEHKYVRSEGAILRWLDKSEPWREIYRGGGKWERYEYESSLHDWLYGTPIDESAIKAALAAFDKAA